MSKKFLFVFNELWLDQFVCWVVFLIVWMIECRVYFNVFQFILFLGDDPCLLLLSVVQRMSWEKQRSKFECLFICIIMILYYLVLVEKFLIYTF